MLRVIIDCLFLVLDGSQKELTGPFLLASLSQQAGLAVQGDSRIALIFQHGREAPGQCFQQSGRTGISFFGLDRLAGLIL